MTTLSTFILNGHRIPLTSGQTILEAATDAGVYIPALCFLPGLAPLPDISPDLSCRLCIVEANGNLVLACQTPVSEGMTVNTETDIIREQRKKQLADILRRFPPEAINSWRREGCELQQAVRHIGLDEQPPQPDRKLPVREDSPFFIRDNDLCINCRRCVRACTEVQLNHAIEYAYPCHRACPAGIDIPRYIRAIAHDQPDVALAVVREKVPFPGVLGRVCIHPCEQACQRGEVVDKPLQIRLLKRYASDHGGESWKQQSKHLPASGKKVAVVGSGPAGLTAAYYLAKQGHKVTVFEAQPKAGGMLLLGIPEYRLPRNVLDKEIEYITEAGVEIKCNSPVTSVKPLFDEGYDAVFLGIGAHKGMKLGIDGDALPGVTEAVEFLRRGNLGERVDVGENVGVVGGGNVAIDAARMALRFGARKVTMFYRRTRAEMPAAEEEIEAAIAEGVDIQYLTAPVSVQRSGDILQFNCSRMQLGEPDATGRPHPVPIDGSEFVTELDMLLVAIGQRPDVATELNVETGRGNVITVDDTMMTSRPGVFSGGDCVSGPASVIEAIQAGRLAAEAIDRYLGGCGDIEESLVMPGAAAVALPESVPVEAYAAVTHLPPEISVNSFDEVEQPWSRETALAESQRCLRCYVIAPPGEKTLEEADCQFCGACVDACPTGALIERSAVNAGLPQRTVTTTCPYCGVGCQLNLEIKNDTIVRVIPADGPANHGHACVKGKFGLDFVHSPERLTVPLIRKNGKLEEATWDEALNLITQKLPLFKPDEIAIISSAKCTNEDNYLIQKFTRAVAGTNNIDHCARL